MSIKRKKILVTGATRGIGYAICRRLLSEDYSVIGTYNTSKDVASKMLKEYKSLELHQVDFSDRKNTQSFVEKLKSEQFYGLVNNAGIILFESYDEFSMEVWDKTMEVNLNAPVILAHSLRENIEPGGVIVNIASTDGAKGSITSIAYSASKAALINVTQSLANVFSYKKVRAVAIAPGWVGDGMDSPAVKDAQWLNPLGRTAKYEEIASVVSFLLSEDASYVNGTTLTVDGGSSAIDYVLKKEAELT